MPATEDSSQPSSSLSKPNLVVESPPLSDNQTVETRNTPRIAPASLSCSGWSKHTQPLTLQRKTTITAPASSSVSNHTTSQVFAVSYSTLFGVFDYSVSLTNLSKEYHKIIDSTDWQSVQQTIAR